MHLSSSSGFYKSVSSYYAVVFVTRAYFYLLQPFGLFLSLKCDVQIILMLKQINAETNVCLFIVHSNGNRNQFYYLTRSFDANALVPGNCFELGRVFWKKIPKTFRKSRKGIFPPINYFDLLSFSQCHTNVCNWRLRKMKNIDFTWMFMKCVNFRRSMKVFFQIVGKNC